MGGVVVVAAILVLALFIIGAVISPSAVETYNRARQAYRNALDALKAKPADPDLRQRALAAGRLVAALSRKTKGVTLFDEVALSNDIAAACAAASAASAPQATQPDVQERLRKLDDLRLASLISEDEYQTKRQQILADL